MTPERWHAVKAALAAVLDCDPAERAACVDRVCGPDAALRREVESLLAASDGAVARAWLRRELEAGGAPPA